MSDQPKKQELPPIEENETDWEYAARLYSSRVCAMMRNDKDCDLAEYKAATHIQMELLAALSDNEALRADNEAKDAQLAEARRIVSGLISQKEFHKDTSEAKDARIAELERERDFYAECANFDIKGGAAVVSHALEARYAAEAKLKSVEGVIAEKLPKPLLRGDGTWYPALMVDALLARIREAVKGDK